MTDRYLITRLLNLDVLETDKLWWPNRHHQLALNAISFTLVGWALHQRVKLPLPDNLVNLKSTHVAHIDRHLHLWLHIAGSHHDTSYGHKVTNLLGSDLSHLRDKLLTKLTMDDKHLVGSLKLLRDYRLRCGVNWCLSDALVHSEVMVLLNVEPTLFHQDVKGCLVRLPEVDRRLWHILVDYLTEEIDVASSVV